LPDTGRQRLGIDGDPQCAAKGQTKGSRQSAPPSAELRKTEALLAPRNTRSALSVDVSTLVDRDFTPPTRSVKQNDTV